jgi:hypothetical protein
MNARSDFHESIDILLLVGNEICTQGRQYDQKVMKSGITKNTSRSWSETIDETQLKEPGGFNLSDFTTNVPDNFLPLWTNPE